MTAIALTRSPAPNPEDVEALVQDVWSSYVGDPDELLPAAPGPDDRPTDWTAVVSITGTSRAMVLVELTAAAALGVSRGMLGLGADEAPDALELADAIGELANVVGGNLKSLLPGPCSLSLPLVAAGSVSVPSDLLPACSVPLSWHGADLRFRLLLADD